MLNLKEMCSWISMYEKSYLKYVPKPCLRTNQIKLPLEGFSSCLISFDPLPPPPVDGVISTKLATIWKLIKSVPQTNNTGIFWNQGKIVILQSRVFSYLFHFPKFYTLSSSIYMPSSVPSGSSHVPRQKGPVVGAPLVAGPAALMRRGKAPARSASTISGCSWLRKWA